MCLECSAASTEAQWCAARVALLLLETRQHRGRDRLRHYARWVVRLTDRPQAGLKTFDRQRARFGDPVFELQARLAARDERCLDRDFVAEPGRLAKTRPGLDHRVSREVVSFQIVDFVHAERTLDQNRRRGIENLEIARIEDDAGGIAIAPFNPDVADVAEHQSEGRADYAFSAIAGPCVTPRRGERL